MQASPVEIMRKALNVARKTSPEDFSIGAVISNPQGVVISSATNRVYGERDLTGHAEVLALRALPSSHDQVFFRSLTLAVTLEPCPMCAWAIRMVGIGKVIFGAYNDQYGAAGSVFDLLRDGRVLRPVEVIGGVLEGECRDLLSADFDKIRHNWGR